MSYVYVIQAGETGPVKIGMADNPASRVYELQTGSPVELTILVAERFPDRKRARRIEQRLHSQLSALRIRGEWFRFDEQIQLMLSYFEYGMSLKEFAGLGE